MTNHPNRSKAPKVDHRIYVRRKRLSDKSEVFDVECGEQVFPALSETAAYAMAEQICNAINEHSVSIAQVIDTTLTASEA